MRTSRSRLRIAVGLMIAALALGATALPAPAQESIEGFGFVEHVDASRGELLLSGGERLLVVGSTRVSDAHGRSAELGALGATPHDLGVAFRGRPGPAGLVLEWLRLGARLPD